MKDTSNCWQWAPDPEILTLYGPFKLRWYGLAFLALFYVGYRLIGWQFERARRVRGEWPGHSHWRPQLNGQELASGFINWAIVGALLGAWLGHRLMYDWDKVLAQPLYLIDIRHGVAGLASHGGVAGLFVVLALYARKHAIPILEMFDRSTFSTILAVVFIRLGNFMNSEVVGTPTDLPWAVCLPRYDAHALGPGVLVPRHPSQLYEVGIGLAVFGLLLLADRLAGRERRPRGLLTGIVLVAYFSLRFAVEFVKEHQTLAADATLTMGQWLSIPFIIAGCALLVQIARKQFRGQLSPADDHSDAASSPPES